MPKCSECKEDVDEVHRVRSRGKTRKLCDECAEITAEADEIAAEAENVIGDLMEYGR